MINTEPGRALRSRRSMASSIFFVVSIFVPRVRSCELRVVSCELGGGGCELRVADCELCACVLRSLLATRHSPLATLSSWSYS